SKLEWKIDPVLAPPTASLQAPFVGGTRATVCHGVIDCRRQHSDSNTFLETPMKLSQKINRRSFINQATTLVVGAGALSASASSYHRILGANDRISLGHSGVGRRGKELAWIVAKLKEKNVEMTAVCDLWKINREAAAAQATKDYGREPRSFQYMEELLALKEVDAVLIATADLQHAPHPKLAAEAGKDCYCEKPMANDLEEAKAARDAVLKHKRIAQIGTQHRSEPYQIAVRDFIKTGALGEGSKPETVSNSPVPRWRRPSPP